ncbi:GMC oxidoreductase [Fomes fomentarius]|nr:GMC oxidoreductase [Fomes fomentarius]
MGQTTSAALDRQLDLYATRLTLNASSSNISEEELAKWKSYDYIIIGGGTAGCVLASRLSEDRGATVLLLEAGESNEGKLFSRIPLAFERMLGSPHDWGYRTTPQKTFGDRTIEMPRGKLLGGTSSINAMIYHQSDPEDFDAWEKKGATGWGYDNMKKFVSHAPHCLALNKVRQDGPRVSTDLETAPISKAFVEAAERLGIPYRKDFNTDEGTVGAGLFHGAIDAKHERNSTATSYLTGEVRQRLNLTIITSVHTERILFTSGEDGTTKAVGVQISTTRNGPKFAVSANREILLCGGVIGSPQVLLLSGVGPAEQLRRLNIPVVRDLPAVGWGLLDHVSPGSIVFRARPGWTWDHITQSPLHGGAALLRWLMFGTGPMGGLCGQVGIFTRSDDKSLPYGPELPVTNTTSGPRAPDIEYMVFPMGIIDYGHGFPPRGNYSVSVGPCLLKPVSAGTIELRTNSVYDAPIIELNLLADQSDLNVLIRSIRLLLHLVRTPPLSDMLDLRNYATAPKDADYYWIGDADPDKVSDEEIEAYIRKNGQSALHPTSSVRMGQDPATSAVDPHLHVHGIQALRVIDTSVFPDQVSGHPCVPVIALAERAADLIRGLT